LETGDVGGTQRPPPELHPLRAAKQTLAQDSGVPRRSLCLFRWDGDGETVDSKALFRPEASDARIAPKTGLPGRPQTVGETQQ